MPSEPPAREFRLHDRLLAVAPVSAAAAAAAAAAVWVNTPDPAGYPDYSGRAEAEVVRVRTEAGAGQPGMGGPKTTVEVIYTVDGREHTSTVAGVLQPEPDAGDRVTVAYDPAEPDRVTVAYDPAEPDRAASPDLAADPAGRRMRAVFTAYFGFMVFAGLAFLGRFAWRNPDLWSPAPQEGPRAPGR
ncbi:DUF3592 domain-containing protein [Nocardiopsis sp. CC223A]|uniref:DUF3592 domain-containing protein n=1 Tax=Nocardiopsis sp. CC223A TaxID=3044051 RepID=UPI00278BD80F|nr:DUF3592 domain-containing protein [Nocardiopsis sp. CC223A]